MKKLDLQQKTNLLLAETFVLGFDSKKYADWALELMNTESGIEEIDILAGLDDGVRFEVEKYFTIATKKLDIDVNRNEEVLLADYANYIAHKVVAKEIVPSKGQELLTEIYYRLDCPPVYESIIYSDDLWYLEEMNGGTTMTYEEFLLKEFQEFITNN